MPQAELVSDALRVCAVVRKKHAGMILGGADLIALISGTLSALALRWWSENRHASRFSAARRVAPYI